MYTVYIIKSINSNKYYIGCSSDFERRLMEHNNAQNISTKKDRPWKVIYIEKFDNQSEAYAREKKIKSYKGGNAFKKLII